jgi:hypothetical protein
MSRGAKEQSGQIVPTRRGSEEKSPPIAILVNGASSSGALDRSIAAEVA